MRYILEVVIEADSLEDAWKTSTTSLPASLRPEDWWDNDIKSFKIVSENGKQMVSGDRE
jgi:hypothetical protein